MSVIAHNNNKLLASMINKGEAFKRSPTLVAAPALPSKLASVDRDELSLSRAAFLQQHQRQLVDNRVVPLRVLNRGGCCRQHNEKMKASTTKEHCAPLCPPAAAAAACSKSNDRPILRKMTSLPITPLRRQMSHPEPPTGRRTIFGHLRERCSPSTSFTSDETSPTASPQSSIHGPGRRRSFSLSVPSTVGTSDGDDRKQQQQMVAEIRKFFPPSPGSRRALTSDHFWDIDHVPELLALSELGLPSLPSPLKRFCKGKRDSKDPGDAALAGAYPLVAPKPILRESSYGKLRGGAAGGNVQANGSFNLTKTLNALKMAQEINEAKSASDDSSSSLLSSSSSSTASRSDRPAVQFDPRVTVTEFEDNAKREWFSDADLERFKGQTIALAQQYLIRHPDMISQYNRPRLDPVTGTMRKKALFSMPALTAHGDFEDDDEIEKPPRMEATRPREPQDPKQCQEERQARAIQFLIDSEVRKILLVDPNEDLLDLFRRSLHQLFPRASITAVQSGEEAIRLMDSKPGSNGGYDIVIAEERLARPRPRPANPRPGQGLSGKSCSHLASLAGGVPSSCSDSVDDSREIGDDKNPPCPRSKTRPGSEPSLLLSPSDAVSGMSGSELLRKIVGLETTRGGADENKSSSRRSAPLLIGVSIHPEQDGESLEGAGADLVWGKPPPSMDEYLRDTLLSRLLQKRRGKMVQPRPK